MKPILRFLLAAVCSLSLIACQHHDKDALRIGTISGPETQLVQVAKEVALKKYGLKIEIVEFSDYVEPNAALNRGSLEANLFQHLPYLEEQIKDLHYKLVSVGKTFVYPMGIYATHIKNIKDVPDHAWIAIPNDPANEGRALLLLQKAGLIQLNPSAGLYATTFDITSNPKKFQFKELDASQLSRSMQEVDLAIINTNYAMSAGLSPSKDAIFLEDKDSPYANIIAVRDGEQNDPRIKEFVQAFQSPEVADKAKEIFNGQAIVAW